MLDLGIEIIAIMVIAAVVWNIAVFAMYGIDKRKAQQRKRRISEGTLLLSAALMGGIGALLGMHLFRHKTKHWQFKIGVPFLLLANVAAVVLIIYVNSV